MERDSDSRIDRDSAPGRDLVRLSQILSFQSVKFNGRIYIITFHFALKMSRFSLQIYLSLHLLSHIRYESNAVQLSNIDLVKLASATQLPLSKSNFQISNQLETKYVESRTQITANDKGMSLKKNWYSSLCLISIAFC